MNSRDAFHRAQHWQLAERQRYLSGLEALDEKLRADVEALAAEIDLAGGADALPSNPRLDPHFIRPLVERRDKLQRSIAEVEAQITDARNAVAAARQELKLVEGAAVHGGYRFEDRLTRRARRST
jgi:multidrug resistance efflux pump